MDLKEYDKALSEFDWSYEMADEQSVWLKGNAGRKELQAIAQESDNHAQLYDAWNDAMWPWPSSQEYYRKKLEEVRKQLGVI
jgi:hypothetical protein